MLLTGLHPVVGRSAVGVAAAAATAVPAGASVAADEAAIAPVRSVLCGVPPWEPSLRCCGREVTWNRNGVVGAEAEAAATVC